MGQLIKAENKSLLTEREEDLIYVALDALADCQPISVWANHTAEDKLGRTCAGEGDDEWFAAVAEAYDQLLDAMKKINSIDIPRVRPH